MIRTQVSRRVLCYQCEMDCLNNCITIEPIVIMKQDPLKNKPMFYCDGKQKSMKEIGKEIEL